MEEETGRSGQRVVVPLVLAGAAAWGWRILVTAAALALISFVLIQLYVVVVPVVLALFLAAVLEPLAARLRARRWPAALAATTVFITTLCLLLALLFWIGASVAGQFEDVGEQLQEAVEDTKQWAQGDPLNLTRERVDEIEADLRRTARSAGGGLAQQAASRAQVAGEVLGGILLLLFTLFFLLKDGFRMTDWLRERVPTTYRDDAVALTTRSRQIMRQYLIATATTGFIDGVLIGLALWALGVPLVVPLAVLTFLGGFVPLVGATVAGLVAAVVALVANGLGTGLLVVAATVAVQQIEGNLLQPLILERAVKLHPLVTVWAVAAGLVIGGLLGAFLSVPLVAIAVGVGSHYRRQNEPDPPEPFEPSEPPEPPEEAAAVVGEDPAASAGAGHVQPDD
ncbi:MAG: AI-2E family transporter [Actinobacteria bacterium]|nr:AI-2E family transporter [Actinomycetota bacterium]